MLSDACGEKKIRQAARTGDDHYRLQRELQGRREETADAHGARGKNVSPHDSLTRQVVEAHGRVHSLADQLGFARTVLTAAEQRALGDG